MYDFIEAVKEAKDTITFPVELQHSRDWVDYSSIYKIRQFNNPRRYLNKMLLVNFMSLPIFYKSHIDRVGMV